MTVAERDAEFLDVTIPYGVRELARRFGGSRFDGGTKTWVVPRDALRTMVDATVAYFGAEPPEATDVLTGEVPKIREAVAQQAN